MPKYKNISEQDLYLPRVGWVKAGEVTEQPDGFNNANFEKVVGDKKEAPKEELPDKETGEEWNPPKKRSKTKEK